MRQAPSRLLLLFMALCLALSGCATLFDDDDSSSSDDDDGNMAEIFMALMGGVSQGVNQARAQQQADQLAQARRQQALMQQMQQQKQQQAAAQQRQQQAAALQRQQQMAALQRQQQQPLQQQQAQRLQANAPSQTQQPVQPQAQQIASRSPQRAEDTARAPATQSAQASTVKPAALASPLPAQVSPMPTVPRPTPAPVITPRDPDALPAHCERVPRTTIASAMYEPSRSAAMSLMLSRVAAMHGGTKGCVARGEPNCIGDRVPVWTQGGGYKPGPEQKWSCTTTVVCPGLTDVKCSGGSSAPGGASRQ